ncbi:MAG: hypothetical protein Q9160_003295 [Pyrenula sp. 1 TL-2023]
MDALLAAVVAAVAALIAYVCCYVLYQLFLNPLSKIPGPQLASISRGYEMYYDLIKNATFPWKLAELHAIYAARKIRQLKEGSGSIVRIAPDEVHINDPAYLDIQFTSGTSPKQDKYAPHQYQFGWPQSTSNTIDSNLHKMRRGALAGFFSRRSILALEPMIREKVEKTCFRLSEVKTTRTPVDLRLLFSCMTTDVITEYAFPRCFDLLSTPDLCPAWRNTFAKGLRNIQWLKHFPFLWDVLRSRLGGMLARLSPDMRITQDWETGNQKLIKDIVKSYDPSSMKKEGSHPTIFHDLLSSDLPAQEKSYDRLCQEGSALIGAGVETTSNTLNVAIYYLHKDHERLNRLKAELQQAMPKASELASWKQLETLPYLTAVIHESLRLALGTTSRFIRVAPNDTLQYKHYTIPPGTAVSVSVMLLHHHEPTFADPSSFSPERWLDNNDPSDLLIFGKGPRKCLGINLAYAELYLALAAIVRRFDLELFETTLADIEPEFDAFVPIPKAESKGVRMLVK